MKLVLYRIKNLFSIRETILSLIAVIIAVSTGLAAFTILEEKINIYIDGNQIIVKTLGSSVADAIRSANIQIDPNDYVSCPLDSKLTENSIKSIYIKKAKFINIDYGGFEFTVPTVKTFVAEVLSENNMVIGALDKLEGTKLSDKITDGMELKITKVEKKLELEHEETSFNIIASENKKMDFGDVNIIIPGVKGIVEHAYNAVYENGELVSREKEYEKVLRLPSDQKEDHGIIKTYVTSTGYTIRYTEVIDVRMTAYTASLKDTGKDVGHPQFGVTFTGRMVEPGIVAVDPNTIKLNTKMYVEIDGPIKDYGFSIAADTGGAIKGDLIDLYFDTQEFVDRWGTKRGRVYILADDDINRSMAPD